MVTGCDGVAVPGEETYGVAESELVTGIDLVSPSLYTTSVTPVPSMNRSLVYATVWVCNYGTQPAAAHYATVVFSTDTVINTLDPILGYVWIPGPIASGVCQAFTAIGYTPVGEGNWNLGVIVDPFSMVAEVNEANNTTLGPTVRNSGGTTTRPDLRVNQVTGPRNATPGQTVSLTVQVCNNGTGNATNPTVDLYLSTDTTITSSDRYLARDTVIGTLVPNGCLSKQVQVQAAADPGIFQYYFGAIVDSPNLIVETNEANNWGLDAVGVTIGLGVDLQFGTMSLRNGAAQHPGQTSEVAVSFCNKGSAPVSGFWVKTYLSVDEAITPSDIVTGSGYYSGTLQYFQCATLFIATTANVPPAPDPNVPVQYKVGAIVDPDGLVAELNESNNAGSPYSPYLLVGYGSDLFVSAASGPATAASGSAIQVYGTVCNVGSTELPVTTVKYYASTDATITPSDLVVATATVGPLYSGQCVWSAFNGTAPTAPIGTTFSMGAIGDPDNQLAELRESNNAPAMGWTLRIQ